MTLHNHQQDTPSPHPMKAKRDGQCAECETELFEGEDIVWDPTNFKAYCAECGDEYL